MFMSWPQSTLSSTSLLSASGAKLATYCPTLSDRLKRLTVSCILPF